MKSNKIKLVVFDLDGTLTNVDSLWSHVHMRLGTMGKARESAALYQAGRITYEEWAKADASLWRGVPLEKFLSILDEVQYIHGAREVIKTLKDGGTLVGIVSAGLSLLADRAKKELGADFALANDLLVRDGRLTGDVRVRVSLSNKPDVIRDMVWMLGVDMEHCAVVGDNPSDIPYDAGLKIGFNPKKPEMGNMVHMVVKDLPKVVERVLESNRNLPGKSGLILNKLQGPPP